MTVYNIVNRCLLDGMVVIAWYKGNENTRTVKISSLEIRSKKLYQDIEVHRWENDTDEGILYLYIKEE